MVRSHRSIYQSRCVNHRIFSGMPYPTNLNTALSIENIVRSTGAIPATIALLSGRVHIGLTRSQLERIADTGTNKSLVKLSRRDLAPAIAAKRDGGTTIAGTMVLAELAGIKVSLPIHTQTVS